MADLLPLFLNLAGRDVVLVGGGRVAAGKLRQLAAVGAHVRVVAPNVCEEIEQAGVSIARRAFRADDLDGAWLAVAAATPDVNREVAAAADARHLFVNAVDDPPNASAFLSGVVRRDGVTIAISTEGDAPALTSLLRQALDAMLPRNLRAWLEEARRQRKIWKRDRVPMTERTPRLLKVLNDLNGSGSRQSAVGSQQSAVPGPQYSVPSPQPPGSSLQPPGHVSLVGAGPGDPGLLTRRALSRLRAADLVLYDALIDDRILRYARKAQRFFVGKRAGRRAMSDDAINSVMIRAARRGRRVVRLKGGDPFVFGRGGEEALALARAGVTYEIVPGVTSAVAAPALAGIPVTFRGVASGFYVLSGHDEAGFATAVSRLQPAGVTLVILMGMGRAHALAETLIGRGWSPASAAAIIVDASHPGQRVWRGTLRDLAAGHGLSEASSPDTREQGAGTIVVGEVVALADSQDGTEGIYVNSR